MLTASVRALIPTLYTGPATQTPLGNTLTQFKFTTAPFTSSASYYRFATDDAADGATTSIYTNPETTLNGADAGIALFDANGNLLSIGDADASPSRPGFERLNVTLQPKTEYILGLFSLAGNGTIDVAVALPKQAANTTLTLDSSTGQASLDATGGEDTYNAPADPDYYPLNFFNGKANGVVTVSPLGLNVQSTLAVLQQVPRFQMLQTFLAGNTAWQTVATDSGAAPTVNVSPSAGQNLADGTYLLSVEPLDFTSPARSYHIDASADTLAAPAVDAIPPIALGMPALSSLGQASLQHADIFTNDKVFTFTAPVTGPLSLQVSVPLAGTTLALYDETGQTLLAARGRTTAAGYTYTFDATAGTTYSTTVTPASDASVGASLIISQAYTPDALSVVSGAVSEPGVTIGGSAGAKFYRVALPKGIDALAIRLNPSDATGGNISLRLFNANLLSPIGSLAAAGQPINAVFDARTYGSDVDIEITSDNAAPVDFSIAAIDVPNTLPASTTISSLDLSSGDLSTNVSLSASGEVASAQFWALNTGTTSTISVTGDAGSATLLAQYEDQDGVLKLIDFTLPTLAGVAQRTVTINPARLAAVAAINARLDGVAGNVQIAVDGAKPVGVGIAMAPEAPPFTTNLRIRTVPLRSSRQRDLWETTFPQNVLSTPTLSIGPSNAGGALALRVLVFDVNNNVLQTITTNPGQQITGVSLFALTPASIAGQKSRFLVEPIGSNLGDGIYTLEVAANTTDPTPFIVNETSFNKTYAQGTHSIPKSEAIKNVNVNSLIDPSSFDSSQAYNSTQDGVTGSIDIYRFTTPMNFNLPVPFAVWTQDLDSTVNTNIGLYRSKTGVYEAVPGVGPNLDFFPSDRSITDARIEVWNTDLVRDAFPAGYEANAWYVIVKNEQGSQGHYRLHVETLAAQQSGPGDTPAYFGAGTTDFNIDPKSGTGSAFFVTSGFAQRLIMPSDVLGNTTITITPNASGIRAFRLDVLDSLGNLQSTFSGSSATGVSFNVSGLDSFGEYFLRPTITFGSLTTMTMSASVPLSSTNAALKPGQHGSLTTIPSYAIPAEDYQRADQFADGTFATGTLIVDSGSGLKQKVVFWVDQPGFASFTIKSSTFVTNRVVGLWRGVKVSGEQFQVGGILKDFSSFVQPDNSIVLQAFVLPGMYYITVDGSNSGQLRTVTANGQLPLPFSTLVTVDPNSGTFDEENLNRVDPVLPMPYPADTGSLPEYRTTFYKVVAPGGSNMGFISTDLVYKPPTPGNLYEGRAFISITRLSGATLLYTGPDSTIDLDGSTDDTVARVEGTDLALPNNEYYIGLSRDRISPDTTASNKNLHISGEFHVPQSGTPDIVVTGVHLEPANGHTKVTVDLINNGHATATSFRSRLHFTNYPQDTSITLLGLGPGATESYSTIWDPTNGTDSATFTADIDNQVAEKDESNNSRTAALNKSRPTISMALTDPTMDGDADPNAWGRYVSDVPGPASGIVLTTADADGLPDIYQTYFSDPLSAGFATFNGAGPFTRPSFDFSKLNPTTATNPNRFAAYVRDQWGLTSDIRYIGANVAAKSNFFTSETFDTGTKTYNLEYGYSLVNFDKTLSEILGFDLPLVGDKRTKLILRFGAFGTATLNPAQSISMPLGGELNITAVDYEIYKINLGGGIKLSDNLMIGASLEVSGKTLDVTAVAASVQLRNLKLLDLDTGKIRLFSFGIPKVASLNGYFRFALKAGISAGLKVGLDVQSHPVRAGILSPTFVQPKITGEADISGDVEVLGFDAADLEGHIGLGLNITVGLDNNDTSKLFTLDDFFDHIKYDVTGELNFGLSAHVWGLGEVWSWAPDPIVFPVAANTVEGIITNDPALPDPFTPIRAGPLDQTEPTVVKGSDPIGAYAIESAPQLVINPNGGQALSVQVVDGDPDPGQTHGQLQYSSRDSSGAPWAALTDLPSTADVADPVLTRMNDAPDSPFMLVYQAIDLPGASADQTFSDRLAGRDLRYRTWNGVAWSDEAMLAGDAGGDSDPAVAFADGAGVAAWVHNGAATPMGEDGQYARDQQEIYAARWDDATQAWLPGEALTADAAADSQPAVFAGDGKMYVVWIHDTATANELVFSTNDGSGWTPAATLPITGLMPGGQFTSLALGSQSPGQINVLFNYRVPNSDGSLNSKLYNRPSTSAGFSDPTGIEVVGQDGNYSHIRTTNLPDGSLVASWKNGDGVINEIFASTLSPSGASAWSQPMQLTQGSTIEQRPSVAVEPSGEMQVLYEVAQAGVGDAPATDAPPMAEGVGGTTAAALPEIGFSKHLDFDEEALAIAGATSTGRATIVNRGLATTDVSIEYLRGPLDAPTVLGTRSARLAPGATFDASFSYPIVDGDELYSVRLSTADPELVGSDDNISSYTLSGRPDLQLVSLQLQNPNAAPSPTNPLVATVRNLSNVPIGAFSVDIRQGDAQFPQNPLMTLATIAVPSLAANADVLVSTPIDVPAVSGTYEFSAVADSLEEIDEASEGNNSLSFRIHRQADPGIGTTFSGQTTLGATLLDSSGGNNVRVSFTLLNKINDAFPTTSGPVTVHLLRSVDDGDFVEVDSQAFASIAPGGVGTAVQFITNGLAGDNRFRVSIEPISPDDDSNLSNNVGEARLQIRGLADLTPQNVMLDKTSVNAGEALTLTLDVANTGIASAVNVLVEVIGHLAPDDGGVVFGSIVLGRVDPLSSTTVAIPLDTSNLAGNYDLTVVVNPALEVLETTDANNTSDPVQLSVVGSSPPVVVSKNYDVDVPGYVMLFNESIVGLDASDVHLVSLTTGQPIESSLLEVDLSAADSAATVRYLGDPTGALPDGWYTVTVPQGSFTNADGIANAADIIDDFFSLNADANHDGVVNTDDFVILATNFSVNGARFSGGDFNYDATVNALDFNALATRYGTSLPHPSPGTSPVAASGLAHSQANLFSSTTIAREPRIEDDLLAPPAGL